MVYRRSGLPYYYIAIPTRTGSCKRSTGTTDKGTAKAIERMLEDLGPRGRRAWDLLEAVTDRRLDLGTLYDAWRMNDLDGLRARLIDPDLAVHILGWQGWLADRVGADCVDRYLTHVRTLITEGQPFPRSGFTVPAIAQWLAIRAVSGPTKRRYLAAVQSFATYLGDRHPSRQSAARREGSAAQPAAVPISGATRRAPGCGGRAPTMPGAIRVGVRRRD